MTKRCSLIRVAHAVADQPGNFCESQVIERFLKVWGVGQTVAERWYAAGMRTLEDLRLGNLTQQQVASRAPCC